MVLTGDNPRAAAAIANELGLQFRAGLLPADKVNAVMALIAHHQHHRLSGALQLLDLRLMFSRCSLTGRAD
jgi:high-affinity K+ transport system ATPase subunit B